MGKLKNHCPAPYSSLSLLEKDALDASDWLRNTTSNVDVSTVVDKNFFDHVGLGSESQKDKAILSIGPLGDEIIANPSSLVKSSGNLNQYDPSFVFFVPSQLVCPILSLFLIMVFPLPPPYPPSGYREPEENDTSLHAVLDSLIHFIRDPKSSIQLHVYLGNFVLDSANCVGEASSSRPRAEGAGNEFS